MAILTPEQMKKEAVWNSIKSILKQNNYNLSPKISITPTGIGFEIDLVSVDPVTIGMTPKGSGYKPVSGNVAGERMSGSDCLRGEPSGR